MCDSGHTHAPIFQRRVSPSDAWVPPVLGGGPRVDLPPGKSSMLELRLTTDAKRVTAMRKAIGRECRRSNARAEHAETVAFVAEQLVGEDDGARRRGRRAERPSEVLVIVTVQSDATMLMVRVARPAQPELGDRRERVLQSHTSRWSTMSGRDGRTIWAEIARTAAAGSARAPRASGRSVAAPEPVTHAVRKSRPGRLRVEALFASAPSD